MRKSRHTPKSRRGQIMLMAAMFLPAMVAFTGLAVDVGHFYHVKRRMQFAADAAAMGGAQELYRHNSLGLIETAGREDAKTNGFDDALASVEVAINHPPQSGPRTGNNSFVEAIIKQDLPTYFLRIVNRNLATIRARGVAGLVPYVDGCVIALDPTQQGALTVEGTSTLSSGCGVMVNSIDSQAIRANGGGCVYASAIGVTGDWVYNGSENCLFPEPVTDVLPVLDPLNYFNLLYAPNPGIMTEQSPNRTVIPSGTTVTLSPGVYREGIYINGGNVTFQPGFYVIDRGDFRIAGDAVVSGNGVTFYITNSTGSAGNWGDVYIGGNVLANFTAPDSGIYEGLLFWMDPRAPDRNPGSEIAGTSSSVFLGAMYFPTTHLKYVGTSDASAWNMIVADTITIAGDAMVQSAFDLSTVIPPTRKVTLVE